MLLPVRKPFVWAVVVKLPFLRNKYSITNNLNAMPVYMTIFSLIIRKNAIDQKYSGGLEQFREDYRLGVREVDQEDDELVKIGAMNDDELDIDTLVEKGLHFDEEQQYSDDFTILYRHGPDLFWKVPWLAQNGIFAWHIEARPDLIEKAFQVGFLTGREINQMFDDGKDPFAVIRSEET